MSIKEQEEEAKKHGFTIEGGDDDERNDADRDFFGAELDDEEDEDSLPNEPEDEYFDDEDTNE